MIKWKYFKEPPDQGLFTPKAHFPLWPLRPCLLSSPYCSPCWHYWVSNRIQSCLPPSQTLLRGITILQQTTLTFLATFSDILSLKIKRVLAKEDFEPISLTYFTENKNRKVLVPLMKVSVSAQGWEVRLVPMGTTITATLDFLCGSWYKSIRNVHRNCN